MSTILVPVLLSTLLTLFIAVGGGYYLIHTGKLGEISPSVSNQVQVPPVIVVAPPASHVLGLEPMIVNLSDAGGHAYLRATISLRIQDEDKVEKKEEKKDPKAVDAVATELRDTTLAVLSRQTSDALLQADGRETLKRSLELEYKQRNREIPVIDIYFTDFLVQRG
jgi:flagellar FliL protein